MIPSASFIFRRIIPRALQSPCFSSSPFVLTPSKYVLHLDLTMNHSHVCHCHSNSKIKDPAASDYFKNTTPHEGSNNYRGSGSLLSESFGVLDNQELTMDENEEKWNPINQVPVQYDPIERLNLMRGRTGVFDLEELIQLLEEKNVFDICAISVPKEMKYVDYLLIVTARSPKHMHAVATFVRHAFKRKNLKPTDILPVIEGGKENANDWLALDLGNIALHMFMEEKRLEVDLESLWLLGPEYDDLTNQADPEILQILHSFSTEDLESPK